MDYSTYWCHGAPGIALSRIAAYRVTRDPSYLDQGRVALDSTLKSLAPSRNPTLNDLVLCHGMIGNADVLLTAARELGSVAPTPPIMVGRLTNAFGAVLDASVSRRLSSGGGSTSHQPGLMTGLAGAAWFHLRLLDATVPSVLKGIAMDEAIPT
jgi:lantibiotic modifying enzyme